MASEEGVARGGGVGCGGVRVCVEGVHGERRTAGRAGVWSEVGEGGGGGSA